MEINKEQVIAYFERSISLKDTVHYRKILESLYVFILWYKTIIFLCNCIVLFSFVFLFLSLYFWQWLQCSKGIVTILSLTHLSTLFMSNSGKSHPRKFYK